LKGVLITPLRIIPTPKGDVLHALKASDPGFAGFGEAYFSSVLPGVTKGWKRHRRMTLNLVVPVGRIRFVLHDDRSGEFQDVVLSPESAGTYCRLTVEPSLWLAFRGEADRISILMNLASLPHDPDEAENCPLEAIAWRWI
jgi:dTDP-4-dehydrorhamnose 3,5-epimerase